MQEKLYDTAMSLFRSAQTIEADNKTRYRDDYAFIIDGEQWSEAAIEQRNRRKRPLITNNILKPILRSEMNQARKAKPSIRVKPSDNKSDINLAVVFEDMIRHIEYASTAELAYDVAAESALAGGFGYLRASVDYIEPDSFDLDIIIEPVIEPLNVYVPSKQLSLDGSQWNDVFIVFTEHKSKYPDANPFNADIANKDDDAIVLCEWIHRSEVETQMVKLSDSTVLSVEDYESDKGYYDALGISVIAERAITQFKVESHILDGTSIIKTRLVPGQLMPIVPVYGEVYILDGKIVTKGLLSDAKDAQRGHNIARSQIVELANVSPRVPYIVGAGGVVNERAWANSNDPAVPYLEYDYAAGGQPPIPYAREQSSQSYQAVATEFVNDVYQSIGKSTQPKETDPESFLSRLRSDDIGSFHFVDNMARAIRQLGKVIVGMIPHVYDEGRIVKIIGESGQTTQVVLPKMSGKYDVTVEPGDNYKSKQDQTIYTLTELIRTFPEGRAMAAPLLIEQLEFNGKEKVLAQLNQPAPGQPQQPVGPSLDQQILMKQAQNDTLKLQVEQQRLKLEEQRLQLENKKLDQQFAIAKADLMIKDDAQSLKEQQAGANIASKLFNDELKHATLIKSTT